MFPAWIGQRYPRPIVEEGVNLWLVLKQGVAVWVGLTLGGLGVYYLFNATTPRRVLDVAPQWAVASLIIALVFVVGRLIQEIIYPMRQEIRQIEAYQDAAVERAQVEWEHKLKLKQLEIQGEIEKINAAARARVMEIWADTEALLYYLHQQQEEARASVAEELPFADKRLLLNKGILMLQTMYGGGDWTQKAMVDELKVLTRRQWEELRKIFIKLGIIVGAKGRKKGELGVTSFGEALRLFTEYMRGTSPTPRRPEDLTDEELFGSSPREFRTWKVGRDGELIPTEGD